LVSRRLLSRLLRLAIARPLTICQFVAPLASNNGLGWLLDAIFRRTPSVTIALRRLSRHSHRASCRAEMRFRGCSGERPNKIPITLAVARGFVQPGFDEIAPSPFIVPPSRRDLTETSLLSRINRRGAGGHLVNCGLQRSQPIGQRGGARLQDQR
jgi:hypothetical protein